LYRPTAKIGLGKKRSEGSFECHLAEDGMARAYFGNTMTEGGKPSYGNHKLCGTADSILLVVEDFT
jgi:hypothetical protein